MLTFPPPSSLTNDSTIVVTGTASDANGVADVSVNGVPATTTDGFAHWQAAVPLTNGANTLTVAASDALGATDPDAAQATIERRPPLDTPFGIGLDAPGGRALVSDIGRGAIVAVDLATGERTILSDSTTGTGPVFQFPTGIAVDGTRVLVVDQRRSGDRGRRSCDRRSHDPLRLCHGHRSAFVRPHGIVVDTVARSSRMLDCTRSSPST